MKYKAIIFDMDGTIISTESLWAQVTKQLLKTHGGLSEEECKAIMPLMQGASLYTTCAYIKNNLNAALTIEELIQEKQRLAFDQFSQHVQLIPGFANFHKHITHTWNMKSAIATNSNQQSVDEVLKYIPLKDFFSEHIYSIDIVNKVAKPKPDIYLHAASELNIEPQHCIAIEDSTHGIAAAKAAGMFCIGINTGQDRSALQQADIIIEAYDEISLESLR